jgi:ribosomal-protein-alanine N-acetyltransferase
VTEATDEPAQPAEWTRVSLLWAIQPHAAEIARLHGRLFPEAWDEPAVSRLLAHPASLALVASHGNPATIGAFALAQIAADEAELLTVGVAPAWRRHGIAGRLLDGIKRAAARSGAASLFLEVAASNASAQALYVKNGFVETARRAHYYARPSGPPEDAVVMRAQLAQTTGTRA